MSALAKAATIASDAILIGLTWVKTFGISKDSSKLGMHTPFATLLLRDGTAYFMYAFEYHLLENLQLLTPVTASCCSFRLSPSSPAISDRCVFPELRCVRTREPS